MTHKDNKKSTVMKKNIFNINKNIFLFIFFTIFSFFISANLIFAQQFGDPLFNNSPLKSGIWRKISVFNDGVYKISGAEIKNWGWNLSQINPQTIQIFGNHGAMLPENNTEPRPIGLQENAITIFDGGDGKFDEQDFILFWGESPHKWFFNTSSLSYQHQINLYSKQTSYFITFGQGNGKRIITKPVNNASPSISLNTYDYKVWYEKEVSKIIHSGKEWLGEDFKDKSNQVFNISVPNPVNSAANLKIVFAGRGKPSNVNYFFNGQFWGTVTSLGGSDDNIALNKRNIAINTYQIPISISNNAFEIKYIKGGANSNGFLDYYEFIAKSNLGYESLLQFSNSEAVGKANVRYDIINNGANFNAWDITNPYNPEKIDLRQGSNTLFFIDSNGNQLKKYFAFDGTVFNTVRDDGGIANQNLAGIAAPDLVIICHPAFLNQSIKLANYRTSKNGLEVAVVTPQQIYNEFSSGSQDISAIRDFLRNTYYKTPGKLKYVLLYGDASFDYLDRIPKNTNFIPTFESEESSIEESSFCSDDFFGYLSANDGNIENNNSKELEISVGRLPAENEKEADVLLEKLLNYEQPASFGNWRNNLVFLADDVDESWDITHALQSEYLTNSINTNSPLFNSSKIYLDAYKEEIIAGGGAYPAASNAINENIVKGSLVFNYIGHGGSLGLAKERVLTIDQVKAWNNINSLPLFITATCELTAFDNPAVKSFGEELILNPKGGAIALLTTTRVVFSGPNESLSRGVWDNNILDISKPQRIGDIYLRTKNRNSGNSTNDLRFSLVGDPSMHLAIPKHKIILDKINDKTVSALGDSFKALGLASLEGHLEKNNQMWNTFNGEIDIIVFDKPSEFKTLANGDNSRPINFKDQRSIIYRGKTQVINGKFRIIFMVPKDINYQIGKGKISMYAHNNEEDAAGVYNDIIIGGSNTDFAIDNTVPEVKIFLNSKKFINGGVTNENPLFLADLFDGNGINLSSSGIGRGIILTLDKGTKNEKQYVLNDFYTSAIGDFQNGTIAYQLTALSAGRHTLHLKVWDTYNNSAEASIYFIVGESKAEFDILKLRSVPNPFSIIPNLIVDHNRPNSDLTLKNELIASNGVMVLSHTHIIYDASNSISLKLSENNDWTNLIKPGVYILRSTISTSNGETKTVIEKIVYTQ